MHKCHNLSYELKKYFILCFLQLKYLCKITSNSWLLKVFPIFVNCSLDTDDKSVYFVFSDYCMFLNAVKKRSKKIVFNPKYGQGKSIYFGLKIISSTWYSVVCSDTCITLIISPDYLKHIWLYSSDGWKVSHSSNHKFALVVYWKRMYKYQSLHSSELKKIFLQSFISLKNSAKLFPKEVTSFQKAFPTFVTCSPYADDRHIYFFYSLPILVPCMH